MKYFQLVALLTALFYQNAIAKCQRQGRIARQNPMFTGLPNNAAYNERYMRMIPTANRRPNFFREETGMPVNLNALAQLPTIRPIQPQYQIEQSYPRMVEMPNLQMIPNMPVVAPTPVSMQVMPEVEVFNGPMPNMAEIINMPMPNFPEILSMPVSFSPIIQERFECPCASQKPLVNPFLPAASPISAWAPPTSNLLPAVKPNQVRSHFLRKIPIPPPTL